MESKIKSPIKLVAFTSIAAFIGAYAWMILLHIGVEVYEIKKLGSKVIGKSAAEKMFTNNTALIIISYIVMDLVMLLITCFIVKKYKQDKLELEDIGMKLENNSFKSVVNGFGIAFVMYIFIYLLMYALGAVKFVGYGFNNQPLLNAVGTVIVVLVVTAFACVCEEILYRGVIQNYLMKKMNLPLSLLISSILFSILHIGKTDIVNVLAIIIPGIVFGYIFAKTKSLYLPIGLHFAYDFIGCIIGTGKTMFNTNYILLFQKGQNSDLSNLIVTIAYLLLLIIMIVKYNKKANFK